MDTTIELTTPFQLAKKFDVHDRVVNIALEQASLVPAFTHSAGKNVMRFYIRDKAETAVATYVGAQKINKSSATPPGRRADEWGRSGQDARQERLSSGRQDDIMLSCSCDHDDADWWYDDQIEVKPLDTKRMRCCCSCKDRIAVGDDCKAFPRWRTPEPDSVAERIYGDEEPLPTWYLCDRCAGLYESLDSLGFCGLLGQDLRATCREYADMQREAGVFRGQMVVGRSSRNAELTG